MRCPGWPKTRSPERFDHLGSTLQSHLDETKFAKAISPMYGPDQARLRAERNGDDRAGSQALWRFVFDFECGPWRDWLGSKQQTMGSCGTVPKVTRGASRDRPRG